MRGCGGLGETAKTLRGVFKTDTPPKQSRAFPDRGSSRNMWWGSPDSGYLVFLYLCCMKKFANLEGLYVRDGRLINDRPCGITGIQEAAQLKASRKRADKIETMSEGYMMAELNSKMMGYE